MQSWAMSSASTTGWCRRRSWTRARPPACRLPEPELYRRTGIVNDAAGELLYVVDYPCGRASTRDYLLHSLGKPEDLTVLDGAAWTHQPQGSLQALTWMRPPAAAIAGFTTCIGRPVA